MTEAPKCGCGRSPTGNCIGWHALSEEEYQEKKTAYETRQAQKSWKWIFAGWLHNGNRPANALPSLDLQTSTVHSSRM